MVGLDPKQVFLDVVDHLYEELARWLEHPQVFIEFGVQVR